MSEVDAWSRDGCSASDGHVTAQHGAKWHFKWAPLVNY